MSKIDPYKHKERFLSWKKKPYGRILELSEPNTEIIFQYVRDMEIGLNVSSKSKKGARSYLRLNAIRNKITLLVCKFEKIFGLKDVKNLTEEQVLHLFTGMAKGDILRDDGKVYRSASDYAKDFKAFWNWHIKVEKKKGNKIKNIAEDLDTSRQLSRWLYLTFSEIKILCNLARFKYKVLIMFIFDTGIRSPTELMNIRVSDIRKNFGEVEVREEVSKTFGRKIKLRLCQELLMTCIHKNNLKPEDYIFDICPHTVNRYLHNLGKRAFGEHVSPAGKKYSELSMYDFRHCSACHWAPKYNDPKILMNKFGWKNLEMYYYYTRFLGTIDITIEERMIKRETRFEIEQRLIKVELDRDFLTEQVKKLVMQIQKLNQVVYITPTPQ